ncbi:hypothetical protein ElyMa_005585000 [Elysia marginata]|uniref:Uncharacterized protein n=1 Tax=Elysia marginata TaxID=1093978 RepID=A0AAV4F3H6_9GAST|nr:hypothetical protein ElyMa_005585000 [Elysia marginata]
MILGRKDDQGVIEGADLGMSTVEQPLDLRLSGERSARVHSVSTRLNPVTRPPNCDKLMICYTQGLALATRGRSRGLDAMLDSGVASLASSIAR